MSTTPSAQVQMAPISVRLIDRETNTSEVDIRSHGEEVRTDIIHASSKGIQVPSSSSEFSSHNIDMEEPLRRPQLPSVMPQLDGPTSVHAKRKQPILMHRKETMLSGGRYPDESDSDSHDNRSSKDGQYPGRCRYYQERSGRLPDRDDNQGRGYPRRGRPPNDGGPPDGGGRPLIMEDPLMMEDPLIVEDPQETEGCQEDLEDKDHHVHQDLLGQCIQ